MFGKELLLYVSFVKNFDKLCMFFFPFWFEGGMLDLIVLISDHCLSIYSGHINNQGGCHNHI